jgi:hypothetical protein
MKPSSYFFDKVINWACQLKGRPSSSRHKLVWSEAEQKILYSFINEAKSNPLGFLLRRRGFRQFLKSIVENGLNQDDVRLFWLHRDRLFLNHLGLMLGISDFSYQSRTLVSKKNLSPGFYMVEIGLQVKNEDFPVCAFEFSDITNMENFHEKTFMDVYPNRICKRLIWINCEGRLNISMGTEKLMQFFHFRVVRVTEQFFLDRSLRKLMILYKPEFNYQLKKIYSQYNSLFSHAPLSKEGYGHYINEVEVTLFRTSDVEKMLAKKLRL